MEYFGLYAETRRRRNVDGHVGSHDDDSLDFRTGIAHRRGFYVHIIVMMSEESQNSQSASMSDFRRESSRTISLFTSHPFSRRLESFNIDADMSRRDSRPRTVPQTPMPNIDDDLSMQKYIQDRRVIGVNGAPIDPFLFSLYAPSMTLSSHRPSFVMRFDLLQSLNALLPLLVTMPHAYWLVTMIESLSLLALVQSTQLIRRSTTRSCSRRKCPPGQISS